MVAGEDDGKNSSVVGDKLQLNIEQQHSEEMGGGDANQVQLSEEIKDKLSTVDGDNDDNENAKEINEKQVDDIDQSSEEVNQENGMKHTETALESTDQERMHSSNGNWETAAGGSVDPDGGIVDPMLNKIKVEDDSDGEIADSDNDDDETEKPVETGEQQTSNAATAEDKPMVEKTEKAVEGSNNYVDIDEMDKLDFGEDEEEIPATDQLQNAQANEDVEKSDGEIDDSDGEVKDDDEQPAQPPGDDFEEGEMFDPDAQQGPPKICRFFQRGNCTWGDQCKFIHPGVNDKGGYSLFDSPKPEPPRVSRLLQPEYIYKGGSAVDPRLAPPGGFLAPPKPETAWERGLRHAKEMRRQSMQRKVHEPDFMRKREVISCNEKLNVDRDMDFIVAKSFADEAMVVDPFIAMDEDERYAIPSLEEIKRIKKFEKTNKAMEEQRSRPLISPHRRHDMHPAPQRHPADERMRQDKRPMPSPGQHPGDRNRRSLNRHGSPCSPQHRRRSSRSKSRSRSSLSRSHARSPPPRSLDRSYGPSRNDGYGSYGAPPVRDDAYKNDRDHRSERRFERDRDHRVGQSRLLGKEPERKKDVDSRVVSIASQPDYNRTNRQRPSSNSGSGKRNDAYVDPWARTGRARRNSRSSSESSASSRSSSSGSSSSSSRSSGSSRSSSRSSYSSGSSSSDSSRSPSPSRGRKVAIKNKVLKKKASAAGKVAKPGKADKLAAAQAKSAKATPPSGKHAPPVAKKTAPPPVAKTKSKQPIAKVKGDRGRQSAKATRPKKKSRSSSSEFSHSDSSASRSRSRSKNKGSGSDSDSGSSSSSSSGSDSYSSSSGSDSGSDSEDDRRKSKKVTKNGARGKAGAKVSVPSKPGRKNVKMTIINKNQQAMNKAAESRKRSANQMQSSGGKSSSTAAPRKVSAINNRRVQLLEQLKDVENAILRKKAKLH